MGSFFLFFLLLISKFHLLYLLPYPLRLRRIFSVKTYGCLLATDFGKMDIECEVQGYGEF
ncbi:MAG: hypothetical protein A3H98_11850 [Bacteroidetes bacterium RIFCSPLOWO2_02_FULL_36_8]|nr:MAG: hypothetical protein A3H98_11850 [Bacteroidetes bacterium RIFCSPLOWO2_02_FULL_36_8]OFY69736.1 MAG: hypothetical protein A3G23_11320 [Bacteroidetes bacterium RIFCSPLOWO2_12_FULL_37_12]